VRAAADHRPGPVRDEFIFQAGQPPQIKEAYCRAMGLETTALALAAGD
jgi:hypothetical protein